MSKAEPGSIVFTGAEALVVVEGMTSKNQGFKLRLKQPQLKGENGCIKGRFEILEAGDGTYSSQIAVVLGETMNAEQFDQRIIGLLGNSSMKRLTVLDRNSLRVVS